MHINVMGKGPDLVMLHGWSMNSAVWHDLAENLAKSYTLHLIDLPGHGQSDWQPEQLQLDVLITNLANALPEKAYYLAWSLGGLISLAFAECYPERVEKLILLAATPCFVKTKNWSCAMEPSIFNAFADNLNDKLTDTLQRFLLLQARGSQHSRETIRQLRDRLATENPPHADALREGLNLLITTDMRQQLATLSCPVTMILGEQDSLIPSEMLVAAQQLNTELTTTLLAGAGHAPFIAQASQCQTIIEQFINE